MSSPSVTDWDQGSNLYSFCVPCTMLQILITIPNTRANKLCRLQTPQKYTEKTHQYSYSFIQCPRTAESGLGALSLTFPGLPSARKCSQRTLRQCNPSSRPGPQIDQSWLRIQGEITCNPAPFNVAIINKHAQSRQGKMDDTKGDTLEHQIWGSSTPSI